jgi:predicted AlkP superfamily pyrophosphatase or phosphodiesterase
VVFITVDQLSPIYFDRFGSQLTGGLGRLLRGGAVFTNGFQDHATTETAPGHASTMSGRFPRSTGIFLNTIGVPDPQAPLIGGGGPGASPFRFRGGTLIDWLRMKDPRARALSVSRKDRGAILPLGRAHQDVYWYASDGRFTTSRYYADTLPSWVRKFNDRKVPQKSAEQAWTLLLPNSAYPEPDTVDVESLGIENVFPHVMSSDVAQATRDFLQFPWMDQLTADLALEGVNALKLGAGASTDILAVSFSTTDAIGHRFGSESREVHDQILRLDRTMGAFIDSLYRMRDSSEIIFALTADHGITPTPELWSARTHQPAYRVSLDTVARQYRDALEQRGLAREAFSFDSGILVVDRGAFARSRINADSIIDAFGREATARPGVLRAERRELLAQADTVRDTITRRWLHTLPPDSPAALVVTLKPNSVWGGYATGIHGGPYDPDAHVPVIFYGPAFRPGRYDGFVRVVDMAPTLAHVMDVTPTDTLDGHVLIAGLKGTAP